MHPDHRRRAGRRRALVGSGLLVAATLVLSGCSDILWRGFLPGDSAHEVTDQTGRIAALWRGSWIAALLVGIAAPGRLEGPDEELLERAYGRVTAAGPPGAARTGG